MALVFGTVFVLYYKYIQFLGGISMRLHESAEMYLETIYVLSQQSGTVRSIDIAEHMGYSKPSVSRAVGLLKQGGYVTAKEDGYLVLTEAGTAAAQKIFERHTLLCRILCHIGVSEQTASEDACKIEHVISDETVAAIKRYLDA